VLEFVSVELSASVSQCIVLEKSYQCAIEYMNKSINP